MKKYLIGTVIIILCVIGALVGKHEIDTHPNNKTATTHAASSSSDTAIDLSNKGISSVGPSIYNQASTTSLILSNNDIQTLPTQMGRMTQLNVFKIDHNQLKGSLIAEIHDMSQLRTLDVSYNNMTGMPAEIGQLHQLQTLNYSYNHITGLPDELASLKGNLKTFNLTGNPLSQTQISKLKASLPNTNIIF